jgi:drug/metabolite transporter (DMT)-like permease
MTLAPIHFATPIAAVLAASVPAVVGIAMGERPNTLAVVGVVLSILSVAMIAGLGRESFGAHTKDERLALQLSVAAGVLFGLHSVVFSGISSRSGIWPVAAEQATGFFGALILWLVIERRNSRVNRVVALGSVGIDGATDQLLKGGPARAANPARGRFGLDLSLVLALVAGTFELLAVIAFLEASRRGMLSVVGSVVALYPAPTIVLAMVVLRERPNQRQALGLAIAAIALVTIGAGSI